MKPVVIILMAAGLAVYGVFFTGKRAKPASILRIPSLQVNKEDSALHIVNGVYYYNRQLFSGTMVDSYAGGAIQHTVSLSKGKEEGWSVLYYTNGNIAEKRYYHEGEKDSVHTGWWQNGKPRFEYHFSNGVYNGDYKEWYSSGAAYKYIHYSKGVDDWGRGWRENGKLFMNYTVRDGRRYGIVNTNLCYTLKNEKGEFTKTTANDDSKGLVNTGNKLR